MRFFYAFLTIVAIALLAVVPGFADKATPHLSEICLKSPNGEHWITLKATDEGCTIAMHGAKAGPMGIAGITMRTFADRDGAGVWLVNGKTGRTIAMYDGGFGIFNSTRTVSQGRGCEVALSADAKGGYLQLYSGKEVTIFGRKDLLPPAGLKISKAGCSCVYGGDCLCGAACDCRPSRRHDFDAERASYQR